MAETIVATPDDKLKSTTEPTPKPIPVANVYGTSTDKYSGALSSQYDLHVPYEDRNSLDIIRGERQSGFAAVGDALIQSVGVIAGQTLQSIGAIVDAPRQFYQGDKYKYDDILSGWGKDIQEFVNNAAPIYVNPNKADLSNFNYWMTGAPSIMSAASMLIPSMGAAKLAGGLANMMRIGELGTSLLEIGVGAIAGRHAEGHMEAAQVYDDAYRKNIELGLNADAAHRNASQAASLDYKMNWANIGFDVVQMAALIAPFGKLLKGAEGITKNLATKGLAPIRQLGYELAEARALDMTGKSVLDGAKWYEKVAGQTLRFAAPVTAQLGEGVEEMWNTISQKEGEFLNNKLTTTELLKNPNLTKDEKEQLQSKQDQDEASAFTERLASKYLTNKDVAESGLWGVIGGMAFHGLGKVYNYARAKAGDKDAPIAQGLRAANLAARKNLLTEYNSTMADETKSPVEKTKTKIKSTFLLAQSAMQADNLDLLLSDMEDKGYQELLANQSGVSVDDTKNHLTNLKKDIEYISNAYSSYRGLAQNGFNSFQQDINVEGFGNNDWEAQMIKEGKLPPSENLKMLVKRGYFQYTEDNVAQYLTQLDYFSHKAAETSIVGQNFINEQITKMDDKTNNQFHYVVDNLFKTNAVDKRIQEIVNEKNELKETGLSDASIKLYDGELELLNKEKTKLTRNRDLLKMQTEADTLGAVENYDVAEKNIKDQYLPENGNSDTLQQSYASLLDDQMIKYKYASERSSIIKDPKKYYTTFQEDNERMSNYHKSKFEDATKYNIVPTDTNEIRVLKRQIVDDFDDTLKTDDKKYNAEHRDLYKKEFQSNYEEFVKRSTSELSELQKESNTKLAEFDLNNPSTFKYDDYIKQRAETESIDVALKSKDQLNIDTKTIDNIGTSQSPNQILDTNNKIFPDKDYTLNKEDIKNNLFAGAHDIINTFLRVASSPNIVITDNDSFYSDQIVPSLPKRTYNANARTIFLNTVTDSNTDFVKILDDSKSPAEKLNALLPLIELYKENIIEFASKENIGQPVATQNIQFDSSEINNPSKVYNLQPEPSNTVDVIQFVDAITRTSAPPLLNTPFVQLSHGTSFLGKTFDKQHRPVLSQNAGTDYTFDLALKDPTNPMHLKAGDEIQLAYAVHKGKEQVVIFKKNSNGYRYRVGYANYNTNNYPAAQRANESTTKLLDFIKKQLNSSSDNTATIALLEQRKQEELKNNITLLNTAEQRRPNGSIGTQGFTETSFINLARFISDKLNLNIPTYDKTSKISEISQIINYLKNNESGKQAILEYVKSDPIVADILPDDTYHFKDGNHRANLLNLIGVEQLPIISSEKNKEIIAKYNKQIADLQKNNKPKFDFAKLTNAELDQLLYDKQFIVPAVFSSTSIAYDNFNRTEPVTSDSKVLHQIPLLDAFPSESINNPTAQMPVFLATNVGFDFTVNNLSGQYVSVDTLIPNGFIDISGLKNITELNGQTFALVPTDQVYGESFKTDNSNLNGKRRYVPELLSTVNIGTKTNKAGDNIATLLIKKLAQPYKNEDFIRSLVGKNGIIKGLQFKANEPLTSYANSIVMSELFGSDNKNIITIVNQLLFAKTSQPSKTTKDYTYPFFVGAKTFAGSAITDKDSTKNIPNVSLSLKYMVDKKWKEVFFPIGNDLSDENLKALSESNNYTNQKPFRVDMRDQGQKFNSQPYTGFIIENDDVVVKTYPSGYIQYLHDNQIVKSTLVAVPYQYTDNNKTKTAYSVTGNPQMRLNLSDVKGYVPSNETSVKSVPFTPLDVLEPIALNFNHSTKEVTSNNTSEDVKRFLQGTTQYKLDANNTTYGNGEFIRTGTALKGKQSINNQATVFGSAIDNLVRDYFNKPNQRIKYESINEENTAKLYNFLDTLKKYFESNNETPYADERVVFDRNLGTAGALDIVTVDDKHNIRIYDMKSLKDTLSSLSQPKNKRIQDWTNQLNAYRIQAQNTFGVEVAGIYVIPFSINYGTENKEFTSLNVPDFDKQGLINIPLVDKIEGKLKTFELRDNTIATEPIASIEDLNELNQKAALLEGGKVTLDAKGKYVLVTNKGENTFNNRNELENHIAEVISNETLNNNDFNFSIVSDVYNSSSLAAAMQDLSLKDVVARQQLTEAMTSLVFEVLYKQTLGFKKSENIESSLKNNVKSELLNNKTYLTRLVSDAIKTNKLGEIPVIRKQLSYINELLLKFDRDDFDLDTKNKVGEFIGYYKSAFYNVSASSIVKVDTSENDDFELEDTGAELSIVQRHEENRYAKINPKTTVAQQAKFFLSSIPIRKNGQILTNAIGKPKYHSLDEIMTHLYRYTNDISAKSFEKDLQRLSENDAIIGDMVAELSNLSSQLLQQSKNLKIGKDEIYRKLGKALLMQNRNIKIVVVTVKDDGTGTNIRIISANRQQIKDQVTSIWTSGFKEKIDQFYKIENILNDAKIEQETITSLIPKTYKNHEKLGKPLNFVVPTYNDVMAFNPETQTFMQDAQLLMYNMIKSYAETAHNNPKVTYNFALPEVEEHTIYDTKNQEITKFNKASLQNMLNYVSWPENVRFKESELPFIANSEIASVTKAFEHLISEPIGNTKYADSTYKMMIDQLDRLGIQLGETEEMALDQLRKLHQLNNFTKKPNYLALNPKIDNIQNFYKDSVVNFLYNLGTVKTANNEQAEANNEQSTEQRIINNVDAPFEDMGIAMRNLTNIGATAWPSLQTTNLNNILGDKEFTVNPHTYLSSRWAQFQNDEQLRQFLLNENPLSKDSNLIKEIFKSNDNLANFKLADGGGLRMNNVPYDKKKVTGIPQMIADYNLFQNDESIIREGRGYASYITVHGESTSQPLVSIPKRLIDYDFVNKDGNISVSLRKNVNSQLYSDLLSQFKGEMNRIAFVHNVVKSLNNRVAKDGFDAAKKYAEQTYKVKEHYTIENGMFKPGSGYHSFFFGKELFNDSKNLMYDDNGFLRPEIAMYASFDGQEQNQGFDAATKVFNAYVDDFLTQSLDKHLEVLNSEKDTFFRPDTIKIGKKETKGLRFPLFSKNYTTKMNLLLTGADSPVSIFNFKNGELQSEQSIKDVMGSIVKMPEGNVRQEIIDYVADEKDKLNSGVFEEYQKRYIASDFIFNQMLFKNTYFALTEDPSSFKNSDNYDAVKTEMDKRLKHHLAPGTQSLPLGRDMLPVIKFQDVKVGFFKTEMTHENMAKLNPHVNAVINFMQSDKDLSKYIVKTDKGFKIPTNYDELALIYRVHANDDTSKLINLRPTDPIPLSESNRENLKTIFTQTLNQEATDAGSLITLREYLARQVRNGEISPTKAVKAYAALNSNTVTDEAMGKLSKEIGYKYETLFILKYIYSGNNKTTYTNEDGSQTSINDFTVIKNSDLTLNLNLTKNTVFDEIRKDLEKREIEILNQQGIGIDSERAFETGVSLTPMSAIKAQSITPISLFNEDGSYTGNLKNATVELLDRNQHRLQNEKGLKDSNEITLPSQALPFAEIDDMLNSDYARVNNHDVAFVPGSSYTAKDIHNTIYASLDEQMSSDLNLTLLKHGVGYDEKGNYVIQDLNKMIGAVKDQMVNQLGIGVHLEALQIVGKRTPLPITMSPFNSISQSVIINTFSKVTSGRKLNGDAFIQASAVGHHKVGTSDILKGYTVKDKILPTLYFTKEAVADKFTASELVRINTIVTPEGTRYQAVVNDIQLGELAIGWNFRDENGKLLDYYEYVDAETGIPKPDKIDDDFLKVATWRVPNTGANTIYAGRIARFLPPSHKDVVLVNAQLMTMMSSDLDVDVLYTSFFNFNVIDGKISKIKSVISKNQMNADSLLNNNVNRERVAEKTLSETNINYHNLKQELHSRIKNYATISEQLRNIMDNADDAATSLLLKNDADKKKLSELIGQLDALDNDTNTHSELVQVYNDLKVGNALAKDSFADVYNQKKAEMNINADASENELYHIEQQITNDILEGLQKDIQFAEDRLAQKSYKGSTQYDTIYNALYDDIETIREQAKIDSKSFGAETITSLQEQIKGIKDEFMKSFDFDKLNIYQKQTPKQLQNGMLETFLLRFTNPNMNKRATTPLSTILLENKMSDNVLQWYDGSKLKSMSMEQFNDRGFQSINDYQSQKQFTDTAKINSTMIGIFASFMRFLGEAQRNNFHFVATSDLRQSIRYAKTLKIENKKMQTIIDGPNAAPVLKLDGDLTEQGRLISKNPNMLTDINSTTYKSFDSRNSDRPNKDPDLNSSWRYDKIDITLNNGKTIPLSTIVTSSLQAALDGIKNPILSKMGITENNIPVFLAHIIQGHLEEAILLLKQPLIVEYQKLIDKYQREGQYFSDEMKTNFITNYISDNKLMTDLEMQKLIIKSKGTAVNSKISIPNLLANIANQFNIAISEADLSDGIVRGYNLDEQGEITNDPIYHLKQLAALSNYVTAAKIGSQFITVSQALSPFSNGAKGSILETIQQYKDFRNLSLLSNGVITSSVPNIGNIDKMSPMLQHTRNKVQNNSYYTLPYKYAIKPINDVMSSLSSNMYIETHPLMNQLFDAFDNAKSVEGGETTGKFKKKLTLEFTSFLWTHPEIYKDMFTNDSGTLNEDEYKYFKEFGRDNMMAFRSSENEQSKLTNPGVFAFPKTLAMAAKEIGNKKDSRGIPYAQTFKLLNAFAYFTGNTKLGNPDYISYMNIADYKNTFDTAFASSIPAMLDSGNPELVALAKQLVLYAQMTGGVSSPNSFVKHIPPSILSRFNIGKRIWDFLDLYDYSVDGTQANPMRKADARNLIKSFIVQYYQHNRFEAPKMQQIHIKSVGFDNVVGTNTIEIQDKYKFIYNNVSNSIPVVQYQNQLYILQDKGMYEARNSDGSIREGQIIYVQMDTAGNTRRNYKEYTFNDNGLPVQSLIKFNMTAGNKQLNLLEKEDEKGEPDVSALESYRTLASSEDASTQDAMGVLNDSGPLFIAKTAMFLQSNLKVNVPITFVNEPDSTEAGKYDHNTNTITINSGRFLSPQREDELSFEKALLHETAHAGLDHIITSVINPKKNYTIGNESKRIITETEYNTVKPIVQDLQKAITLLSALNKDSKLPGSKVINDIKKEYAQAFADRNQQFVSDHEYMRLFDMLDDLDKKSYTITKPSNPQEIEAVTEVVSEFLSYFVSNKNFQQLLNDINVDETLKDAIDKKTNNKANKSFWSHIMDILTDLLDFIGGKTIRSSKQIAAASYGALTDFNNGTLGLYTAHYLLDLLDTAAPIYKNIKKEMKFAANQNKTSNSIVLNITRNAINYYDEPAFKKRNPNFIHEMYVASVDKFGRGDITTNPELTPFIESSPDVVWETYENTINAKFGDFTKDIWDELSSEEKDNLINCL